ncbi:hypothetical protein SAMN04487771_10134 [[Clostridium] aminophilum]|uniref:Major membrane immunogen, membrane-anchored lipoprotein n=1 Tax=[Clostridium] aminophilum TaxID=1526 RepID=A0A1I0DLA5_9FIRM|nr:hypothetical protein [[Clostridium] aminophilum]SET32878.1 hypothetical protein SAMN04487771_10134 [[Clostridium] aminophilum]
MKKARIAAIGAALLLTAASACGSNAAGSATAGSASKTAESAAVSTAENGALETAAAETGEPASESTGETKADGTKGASAENAKNVSAAAKTLEDGVYQAEFKTDSSMFHVSEANDGKGVLTVRDGKMTMHVSLASVNIMNLFCGTADEAQKDGAEILSPTIDTVKYKDGTTEEVNGFDIPVSVIGEEFDCAILGKKGKWYDHKVQVLNPVKAEQ